MRLLTIFFENVFANSTSKGCINSSGLRLAYLQITFNSTKRNSANYIVGEIIP